MSSLGAPPLVERYLQGLATERGCSPRTIEGYRGDLGILARLASERPGRDPRVGAASGAPAVGTLAAGKPAVTPPTAGTPAGTPSADGDWTALTEHELRRWVAAESRAGRAPKSIARRLSAWRGFYDWLSAEGLASTNPARGVRAPRAPRRLPKALSPDQAASLVEAGVEAAEAAGAAAVSGTFESLRDLAMLELFYSSGLRLSELTSLDVRHFGGRRSASDEADRVASLGWYSEDEAEVVVTGKGGRRRTVPVGSHARAALARWLAERGRWLALHPRADPRPLFLSAAGRRLANRTVQARLKRLAIARGIPANVHPHVLRHSFASHLLQSSGDLRAVQELLGHASIATTQIYTSLDFQRLAAVYDAAHPRARRR